MSFYCESFRALRAAMSGEPGAALAWARDQVRSGNPVRMLDGLERKGLWPQLLADLAVERDPEGVAEFFIRLLPPGLSPWAKITAENQIGAMLVPFAEIVRDDRDDYDDVLAEAESVDVEVPDILRAWYLGDVLTKEEVEEEIERFIREHGFEAHWWSRDIRSPSWFIYTGGGFEIASVGYDDEIEAVHWGWVAIDSRDFISVSIEDPMHLQHFLESLI